MNYFWLLFLLIIFVPLITDWIGEEETNQEYEGPYVLPQVYNEPVETEQPIVEQDEEIFTEMQLDVENDEAEFWEEMKNDCIKMGFEC